METVPVERNLKDVPNETKNDKLLHDHLQRWRLLRSQKLEKERKGLHESNDNQTNSDENINKEEKGNIEIDNRDFDNYQNTAN